MGEPAGSPGTSNGRRWARALALSAQSRAREHDVTLVEGEDGVR
jgi:hypothetical protein